MFGFSLSKLIFTAIIVAAVWYGFKYVNRLSEERRDKIDQQNKPLKSARKKKPRGEDAEDMVACTVCGTFVAPSSATDCGRSDCPY
jgi:uncharacterized protein